MPTKSPKKHFCYQTGRANQPNVQTFVYDALLVYKAMRLITGHFLFLFLSVDDWFQQASHT